VNKKRIETLAKLAFFILANLILGYAFFFLFIRSQL